MSWGIKITILYVGFVILITSMVYISATNKSELVAKDYYAQELQYQDRINAIDNEKKLNVSINHEILEKSVLLNFPYAEISKDFNGEILFFRPSDSSKDLKIKLAFDENGKQVINKSLLSKGLYKMCISWENNHTVFYKEEIITI